MSSVRLSREEICSLVQWLQVGCDTHVRNVDHIYGHLTESYEYLVVDHSYSYGDEPHICCATATKVIVLYGGRKFSKDIARFIKINDYGKHRVL